MPDNPDPLAPNPSQNPGPTPTGYQRTQGGGFKWVPPTPEKLAQMLPQYEIEALVGRGGMGAVYKGKQKALDRPVAIKILPPEVDDEDASYTQRFKNEARIMAKLEHPAIVAVHDFGETSEGQLYFVMSFIDGTDVHQMIQQQGRLPPEHALAITAHVCDALRYAHEHGVVHRDIKPSNVLINMEGQVKVADFGLAKVDDPSQSSGLTKTGLAMGTPDYVAPETLTLGMTVDGRADLYAVGVMLYQMLTGNVPRGAFKPASVMIPGIDPRFDAIATKAMQHDREERYQTAAEIRRDLDVILTMPLVQSGGAASAAIPKQSLPQKPVAKGPQKPMGKSANVPVRQGAAQAVAGGNDPGSSNANDPGPLDRATTVKSKTPLFIGIGAIAAIAVGAFVMFGGKKPAVGDDVRSLSSNSGASGAEQSNTGQQRLVTSSPTTSAPIKVREEPKPDSRKSGLQPPSGGSSSTVSSKTSISGTGTGSAPSAPAPAVGNTPLLGAAAAPRSGGLQPPTTGPAMTQADASRSSRREEAGSDASKPAMTSSPAKGSAGTLSLVTSSPTTEKFPPGQWVKVFTKLEDLPADLRNPASGMKFEDGWVRITPGQPQRIPLASGIVNCGIRAKIERLTETPKNGSTFILRSDGTDTSQYYRLYYNSSNQLLVASKRVQEDSVYVFQTPVTESPHSAREYIMEFAAVGSRLIGRFGSHTVSMARNADLSGGVAYISVAEPVRDIEVINLDGLPEAEALRLLGVDEKGNDLRALAAKQEQQMAEQAKAVDAIAAIPELKTLHEQFVKLQAERVTAPFAADVAKLNTGYLGGLDREIEKEKKAGHLDGVIVLEAEKKLIAVAGGSDPGAERSETDSRRLPGGRSEAQSTPGSLSRAAAPGSLTPATMNPLPAEDDDATPANLKGLRKIYRDAFAKLEATRAANLKLLTDPLTIRLKQLESTLTQKNRVPDAKVVREYREGLGQEGSAGVPSGAAQPARNPATGGAAASAKEAGKSARAPLKKFPPGDDRKAAEWVLSVGGSVRLAGRNNFITEAADLPRGRFEVTDVALEFTSTKRPKSPIDDLLPLAGLKGLNRLAIEAVPTTDIHWEILPSLPALESFKVEQCGLTDAVFAQLSYTKLKILEINSEPAITGEGIEALATAKSLIHLMFMSNQPSQEGLRQIGKLEGLVRLSLSGSRNNLKDEHLPLLAGLKNLDYFTMVRTAITLQALTGMKQWSGLTELGFDMRPGNTAAEVALLAKAFPKLEGLTFEEQSSNYSADDVRALGGFPRLKLFRVLNSKIDDEALSGLLTLPKLEGLRFSGCPNVTDAALETFAQHKSLTNLILEMSNTITDAGLPHLTGLKSLTRLELRSCPKITPAAIAAFQKARPDVTVTR